MEKTQAPLLPVVNTEDNSHLAPAPRDLACHGHKSGQFRAQCRIALCMARFVAVAILCTVAAPLIYLPTRGLTPTTGPVLREAYRPVTPDLGLPTKAATSLAQLTPWFPAGNYVSPPQGCVVNQVRAPFMRTYIIFLIAVLLGQHCE